MDRRAHLPAALAVVAAAGLVACASGTDGTGHGSAPTAPASASTPPPSSFPSSAPTSSPSPVASSSASDGPKVCAGRCTTVDTFDLGDGHTVELALAPSPSGMTGVSVVILRDQGEFREARYRDGDYPGTLTCSTTPQPNCVVVDGIGAHASEAFGLTFADGSIDEYDSVSSDTPVIDAADLDGNGWIDLISEVSTERPSYATGKRYWVTFTSDGQRFEGTGCTTPTLRAQPKPTIVITGDCP